MAAATGLLDGVREQLVRAPELACLLADRLVATEPGAAIELVACGLRAAAGGRYRDDLRALIDAIPAANGVGGPEFEATLRMRLASVARMAGAPRVALATLRPAFDPRLSAGTTGMVLSAAVAALSSIGWHDDLHTVLVNAEQLCVMDDRLDVEASALSRAEVLLTGARVLRRSGDRTTAAGFARDGLRALDSVDAPSGPVAVGSGYFAALLLELVLVLSDAHGASLELRRAVASADDTVRAPVRMAAASSTAWLAHALATKVPARECPRSPTALLTEAIHVATRHEEFDVLAAAARELAAEQEQTGTPGAAKTVRTADLAAARHRLRMESIRTRLATSCPMDDRSFEVILRELQEHAADIGGFVPSAPPLNASGMPADDIDWATESEDTSSITPNGVAVLHSRAASNPVAATNGHGTAQDGSQLVPPPTEAEETVRLAMRLVPRQEPMTTAPAGEANGSGRRRRYTGSANVNGARLDAKNPGRADSGDEEDSLYAGRYDTARADAEHPTGGGAMEYPAEVPGVVKSSDANNADAVSWGSAEDVAASTGDTTAEFAADPESDPPPGLAHVPGLVVTEGSGGRRRAPESAAQEPPVYERTAHESAAQEPPVYERTAHESAAQGPAAYERATQEPPAHESAAQGPAAYERPARRLTGQEPAAYERAAGESTAQEPAAYERPAQEPAAHESAVQEPAAYDLPGQELAGQEPPGQELAALEPAADERAVREPAGRARSRRGAIPDPRVEPDASATSTEPSGESTETGKPASPGPVAGTTDPADAAQSESGSATSWRATRARRRGLDGVRRPESSPSGEEFTPSEAEFTPSEAESTRSAEEGSFRSGDELLGFADLLAEAMDVYHHRSENQDDPGSTALSELDEPIQPEEPASSDTDPETSDYQREGTATDDRPRHRHRKPESRAFTDDQW